MKVIYVLGSVFNSLSLFVQGNWILEPIGFYAQPNYPIAFAHPHTPAYTPSLYGNIADQIIPPPNARNTEGQIISPPRDSSARDTEDPVIYLYDSNARDTEQQIISPQQMSSAVNDSTSAAVPLRSDEDFGRKRERHDASNRYTIYRSDGDGSRDRRKKTSQEEPRYPYRGSYEDRDRERDEDRHSGKKSYSDRERGSYRKDEPDRDRGSFRDKSKNSHGRFHEDDRKPKYHQHHHHHKYHYHHHNHDRDEKREYSRRSESGEGEYSRVKQRPHFLNAPEEEKKKFGSISLGENIYDADKPYLDVTGDGRSIKVDKGNIRDLDDKGIYISATGRNSGPVSATGVSTDGRDVVVKTKSIADY